MIGSQTYWHRATGERVRAYHWLGEEVNEAGMHLMDYFGLPALRVNDGKEPGNWLRDKYRWANKGDWVIWWVDNKPVRVTIERDASFWCDFTSRDPQYRPAPMPAPKPIPAPDRVPQHPAPVQERKRNIPIGLLRQIGQKYEIPMEYLVDYYFVEMKVLYPDNPYYQQPWHVHKYDFSCRDLRPLDEDPMQAHSFSVREFIFPMCEHFYLDEEREIYLVGIDRREKGIAWRQVR